MDSNEIQTRPPCKVMLRLEFERRIRGLSPTKLGHLLGVSQTRISNIERGHQRPGRLLALRLAKLLGVDDPHRLLEPVRSADESPDE